MEEKDIKNEKEDKTDKIEKIEEDQYFNQESDQKSDQTKDCGPDEKKVRPGFLLKFLIIATMVTVGIFLGIYFGVVYGGKKVASNAADVYASGTGEDLAALYAPGYAAYFEEQFSYASFVAAQQQYLDAFRTELQSYVGEIKKIDVTLNTLLTASNTDDFAESFAELGVYGVSKYKQLDMTWKITGSSGEKEIKAQVFVFKCDDGWCLDYITFMYE